LRDFGDVAQFLDRLVRFAIAGIRQGVIEEAGSGAIRNPPTPRGSRAWPAARATASWISRCAMAFRLVIDQPH
jgi:hypothetical protein